MALCEPFRAWRYNPALVGDLSKVTAPPYDVIGPDLQAELLAEPHNIVHLDLNPGPTDLNEPHNRYRQAAHLLGQWRDAGVLLQDATPAFYVYEQEYSWAGETLVRRGVLARVELAEFGQGIHPHEQTFSGPKTDRFHLTCETRCCLSPVLGIYPDPADEVMGLFTPALAAPPEMVATGRDGVINRVWVVTEPELLEQVTAALAERDIFIADGHHRYSTALRYRDHLEQFGALEADHPARYTLFCLLGSGGEGLRVRPTHRVVSGWPDFSLERLLQAVGDAFEAVAAEVDPTSGEALDAWLAEQPLDSVAVLAGGRVTRLRPRGPEVMAAALPEASAALRGLNVAVLHQCLAPRGLEPLWGAGQWQFVHLASEAVQQLAGGADVAFLLRATPLETVFEVAGRGELMPQKSTYFYPKALTGLVLYPLR